MGLHQTAAIIQCMILDGDDSEHWNQARVFNKSIELSDKVYGEKDFSSWRVDDYVAFSNLSGKYVEAIEEFEIYRKPKKLNAILNPGEFGYAACACSSTNMCEKI